MAINTPPATLGSPRPLSFVIVPSRPVACAWAGVLCKQARTCLGVDGIPDCHMGEYGSGQGFFFGGRDSVLDLGSNPDNCSL